MQSVQYKHETNIPKETKVKKTDRRTLYTQQVIMDAYIQLLKEKPIEKIRVSDICKIAEINRSTFYLHFSDILDVKRAIEQTLYEEFKTFVKSQRKNVKNRQDLSDSYLEAIFSNDTYVTLMSMYHKNSPLNLPLPKLGHDFYLNELDSGLVPNNHLKEWQKDLLYDFILGGISAVQMRWIEHGTSHLREDNQFIDQIVHMIMQIHVEK